MGTSHGCSFFAHHWRRIVPCQPNRKICFYPKTGKREKTDSHTGTTFHGEGFAEHIKEIEAQNPDVLLIAGDFVDDDTSKEDMVRCCQALGEMQTTYGVY